MIFIIGGVLVFAGVYEIGFILMGIGFVLDLNAKREGVKGDDNEK